jgi:hypothetical protein
LGVQPRAQKYSFSNSSQITGQFAPSRPTGGAYAHSSRNAGRVAMDAMAPTDEWRPRVRRSRVVLTPRRWRQAFEELTLPGGDGGKKAVHRGEHDINRRAIAQGRPDASASPVCSCAIAFVLHRTRDRGCSAHPVFPAPSLEGRVRPLFSGVANEMENLGQTCVARIRTCAWPQPG